MNNTELETLCKGITALYSESPDSFTEGIDILTKLYESAKRKQTNKVLQRTAKSRRVKELSISDILPRK